MKTVKPIILTYEDGTEYTLEFNRESVIYAENHGFDRDDVVQKLMTRIPELFFYAFRMHHPTIKRERTDSILFDDLGGITDKVSERLIELYNAPYETLINDTGKPKNAKMTVRL